MKATSSSEAKALSSTRSDSRNSISSSVAPFSRQVRGHRVVAGLVRHFLGFEPVDILQPKAEVVDLEVPREGIAAGVALQRSGDREAGLVEVVQHEERDVVLAAQLLDEPPAGGDAHALRRHDGEVVALAELHRLEQRHEAFLLDEQDGAVAMLRTEGREVLLRQLEVERGRRVAADAARDSRGPAACRAEPRARCAARGNARERRRRRSRRRRVSSMYSGRSCCVKYWSKRAPRSRSAVAWMWGRAAYMICRAWAGSVPLALALR